MDVSEMVVTGITAWLVASGPIALLIGRVLRQRNEQYPVPAGTFDGPARRSLVSAGR